MSRNVAPVRVRREKMTRRQVVELADFMRPHIRMIDEKFCEYINEMSDKRVGDEFGVAAQMVAKLRAELFGHLKAPGILGASERKQIGAGLQKAMADAQQALKRTHELEALLGEVIKKHNSLAQTLGSPELAVDV